MIYDIAYPQKGLNLKNLPDCEAVIIRLGINDHADTELVNFISQVLNLKIPFGLYWFTYAYSEKTALKEVNLIKSLLDNLNKYDGFSELYQLPLFIDYEPEPKYDAMVKPSAFNITCKVFYNNLNNMGLYLNTAMINQYMQSSVVDSEAKTIITNKSHMWWADWTTRAECPYLNNRYFIRQTGAKQIGRIKVDTDSKGSCYKFLNQSEPEYINIKEIEFDGIYKVIIQKKNHIMR